MGSAPRAHNLGKRHSEPVRRQKMGGKWMLNRAMIRGQATVPRDGRRNHVSRTVRRAWRGIQQRVQERKVQMTQTPRLIRCLAIFLLWPHFSWGQVLNEDSPSEFIVRESLIEILSDHNENQLLCIKARLEEMGYLQRNRNSNAVDSNIFRELTDSICQLIETEGNFSCYNDKILSSIGMEEHFVENLREETPIAAEIIVDLAIRKFLNEKMEIGEACTW